MERGRSRKRNRKQKHKGIESNNNNQHSEYNSSDDAAVIDKLSDDVLINILSRMSLKEAARTSVLACRWRYLWKFVFGTLRFDYRDAVSPNGDVMEVEKFESWVSTALELHQGRCVEGLVISFEGMQEHYDMSPRMSRAIDTWLSFAMKNQVQRLELHLFRDDEYEFPSVEMPFPHLRTLRLAGVDIKDEVVHHLLASCSDLEELSIFFSQVTNNLQVVDPPSLRVLKISWCQNVQSLEISSVNLVSLAYGGSKNSLLLKKIPNLCELTIGHDSAASFVFEPKQHSTYSVQLVNLVLDLQLVTFDEPVVAPPELPQLSSLKRLEVQAFAATHRSLLFFLSLIEASPQLSKFRIEMSYSSLFWHLTSRGPAFPAISAAEAVKFNHRSLKEVEMAGFVGCLREEALLSELIKNAPLIERVVIDTHSEYYGDPEMDSYRSSLRRCGKEGARFTMWPEPGAMTRNESIERAKRFVTTLPQQIEFVVT